MELSNVYFNNNVEGFNAEIKLEGEAISKLMSLYNQTAEKAYELLEAELFDFLEEKYANEEIDNETVRHGNELIFATEDKKDASTYDSVVLFFNFQVDDRGDISGIVIESEEYRHRYKKSSCR